MAILDFIYNGETQIPSEDVKRFIEVAEDLKIKGLCDDGLESIEKIPLNTEDFVNKEQSVNDRLNIINDTVGDASLSDDDNVSEIQFIMSDSASDDTDHQTKTCTTMQSKQHEQKVKVKEETVYMEITLDVKEKNAKLQHEISKKIEKVKIDERTMWKCKVCCKLMKKKKTRIPCGNSS